MTHRLDRAAMDAVEGRFVPRERHPRLHEIGSPRPHEANMAQGGGAGLRTSPTFSNEPAAAAETAGDYLREPVAAGQGQIVEEGGAPRGTGSRHGCVAPRLDAESHAKAGDEANGLVAAAKDDPASRASGGAGAAAPITDPEAA